MLFYHNSCYAMGTRLNVVMVEPLLDGDFIFDQIVREVDRLETKLSRFRANSDVCLINENAAVQPVQVDDEMGKILSLCRDYYVRTHGTFDITLPSKFLARGTDTVPIRQKDVFSPSCWDDAIRFDLENLSVAFTNPFVQIDLGGFGKGYAIQKIAAIFKNSGIRNALVSFGESSVLAMGHHPYGDCWKIGLESDQQFDRPGHVFELTDQSISTSGFQKRADHSIGFHIISPLTQRPVKATSLIAVQSTDPLEAETLSTALFATLDADTSFLDNFNDCHIVRIDCDKGQLLEICTNG